MEGDSPLIATFQDYQAGCWLDTYLARCDRLVALYYLSTEVTFSSGNIASDEARKKYMPTAFFFVKRVRAGMPVKKTALFLKVTIQSVDTPVFEAELTSKIGKKSTLMTPNLAGVESVIWWDDPTHRVTLILTERGVNFDEQLSAVLESCKSPSEKTRMVLSASFQMLHGLVALHCLHIQHRDLKIQNAVGVQTVDARLSYHQYQVGDTYFRVPIASPSALVLWPRWVDFGLSGDMEKAEDVVDCLNNIDWMLPPDFVFLKAGDVPMLHNNDEYFSCALSIVYAVFKDFKLPEIDPGILRLVSRKFLSQRDGGGEALNYHISPRSTMRMAKHAFRLVLLLGFPEEGEWPRFYETTIGKYMSGNIRQYIEEMEPYNFLRRRLQNPRLGMLKPLSLLSAILRWNRETRPSCGRELLLREEFAEFRSLTADTSQTVYDWNNWT